MSERFASAKLTHGQTNALVKLLGGAKVVKQILRGNAKVEIVSVEKHIIDMDADPYCPGGLIVESHCKQGTLEWDRAKIKLWLSEGQTGGVSGTQIQEELKGKNAYNANLLDFLLANPRLIPKECQGDKYVFFWATTYRDLDGEHKVRCLHDGRSCIESVERANFDAKDPAAISVNS